MSRDINGRFTRGEKAVEHKLNCNCFRCSGIAWNVGKPWDEKIKNKISKANLGRKHPQTQGANNWNWKGDKVGYTALHAYINKKKIKLKICSNCNNAGKTVWANISYEYKRDLTDWIELCHKCHMKRDAKYGWGIALRRFPDLKSYYDKRRYKI